MTRDRWIVLGLGTLAAVAFGLVHEVMDDVTFSFLHVARHVVSGEGFVANPGEPLLMPGVLTVIAYSVVALLPVDLVAGAQWVNVAVSVGATLTIYALLANLGQRLAGALAAGLYATSTLILAATSLVPDLAFHNLLALLGWWTWLRGRPRTAAVLTGLLIIHRTDGAVQAALMTVAAWLRSHREGRCYLLVVGGITVAWLSIATWYFGEPISPWLRYHQLEATLDQTGPLWRRYLFGFLPEFFWSAAGRWCLPFFLMGCWRAGTAASLRPLLPLLLLLLLHPLAYEIVTPGNLAIDGANAGSMHLALVRPYYFILCGVGMAWAWEVGQGAVPWGRRLSVPAGAMALCLVAAMRIALIVDYAHTRLPASRNAVSAQRLAGEWIARHAPVEASVAADSLGIVSFYAQRRFMDAADGYVAPEVTTAMRELRDQLAPLQLMDRLRPDYFVVPTERIRPAESRAAGYVEAARFDAYLVLQRRSPP